MIKKKRINLDSNSIQYCRFDKERVATHHKKESLSNALPSHKLVYNSSFYLNMPCVEQKRPWSCFMEKIGEFRIHPRKEEMEERIVRRTTGA